MWIQFILENVHFAVYLLAAQVMFAIFWLYLDAWLISKAKREIIRAVGFIIVSISFVFSASALESNVVPHSVIGVGLTLTIISVSRIIGYLLILISLIIDPIQERPHYKTETTDKKNIGLLSPITYSTFLYPILAGAISFLYWRKATTGLENHLKRIAIGFTILTISEFITPLIVLQDTTNSTIYYLTQPFGIIWNIQHFLLFVATVILAKWVFGYLTKRLQSQLFIIFTTSTLIIFVITTTVFTALLLKTIENQTLTQLESDAQVLQYVLQSKQEELAFASHEFSQNPIVQAAIEKKSHEALVKITEKYSIDNNISSLIILSESAQILDKAEDSDQYGESLSEDITLKKVLKGEEINTLITKPGVLTSQIYIQTVTPVKKEDKIIGAIMMSQSIDNAFLDGIKTATGFESALFADNQLTATTIISEHEDNSLGIKQNEEKVKQKVLEMGNKYTGKTQIKSVSYLGTYIPLKDYTNSSIGMIFIGKPQTILIQSIGQSIQLTFLVAIALIIATIIPAYFISRSITSQLH
jgi:hypothetical protein